MPIVDPSSTLSPLATTAGLVLSVLKCCPAAHSPPYGTAGSPIYAVTVTASRPPPVIQASVSAPSAGIGLCGIIRTAIGASACRHARRRSG